MKKITLGAILLFSTFSFGQEVVFKEDFGDGPYTSTVKAVSAYYANPQPYTFNNSYPITYSSTGYIGNMDFNTVLAFGNTTFNVKKADYLKASNKGIFILAYNSGKVFINNINIENKEGLKLSFGLLYLYNNYPLKLGLMVDDVYKPLSYITPTVNQWANVVCNLKDVKGKSLSIVLEGVTFSSAAYLTTFIDDILITSTNTLATNSFDLKEFSFYPNPAKDILYFTNTEVKKVRIVDVLGKVVVNTTASESLDISDISQGVYICTIEMDRKSVTRKLIVE